jgi:hypothetical protein
LTDNSIDLGLAGYHAGGAQGFASITHNDFYSVPVNGPVFALVRLTCSNLGVGTTGDFSLGSTTVSPPVESIFPGDSQGSGRCGNQYQIASLPPAFAVSLVATNNLVFIHTYIDASGFVADFSGSLFVQLIVNGFEDANGNPIPSELVPEPGTLGTFGLSFLIAAGLKWKRRPAQGVRPA